MREQVPDDRDEQFDFLGAPFFGFTSADEAQGLKLEGVRTFSVEDLAEVIPVVAILKIDLSVPSPRSACPPGENI